MVSVNMLVQLKPGKMADIVLWKPALFGAKAGNDDQRRNDHRCKNG